MIVSLIIFTAANVLATVGLLIIGSRSVYLKTKDLPIPGWYFPAITKLSLAAQISAVLLMAVILAGFVRDTFM